VRRLSAAIDRLNMTIGKTVSWLMLGIVLVQFAVVLLRYVFGIGSIWLQESILYMHCLLFLLAAGYTLAVNAHVRVDVYYREASLRKKAAIDLIGCLLFLLPLALVIFSEAWPFVVTSWSILEGSRETSGIPAMFLLKTAILIFSGLLALQGVSLALKALLALGGQPDPFASFQAQEPAA